MIRGLEKTGGEKSISRQEIELFRVICPVCRKAATSYQTGRSYAVLCCRGCGGRHKIADGAVRYSKTGSTGSPCKDNQRDSMRRRQYGPGGREMPVI